MRYFIELSYDGTRYHGWQSQPNAISVQETIEKALSTLLRKDVAIVGAGRTDAGVHAQQMFAHFETANVEEDLAYRLNAFLPKDIAIRSVRAVNAEAHARFDATARTYEYWIARRKDPFLIDKAYQFSMPLDLAVMNEAAEVLLTYNDFQCFSRSKTDVKTYHCKIEAAFWQEREDLLVFTITADRFLRNMVRAIVGTLLEVGQEKLEIEDLKRIIESKDRREAGASAPAQGLYLTQVEYPQHIFING